MLSFIWDNNITPKIYYKLNKIVLMKHILKIKQKLQ